MTLKVTDPLWSNYITPQWPPNAALEGRLGIEYGTDKWALIPGVQPMLVQQGENGRRVMVKGKSPSSTWYPWYANVLKDNLFTPDHYAEVAHNPPVNANTTEVKDCGPSVRQDPNSDSCYTANLWYKSPINPYPRIAVSRINNGVKTLLGIFNCPLYSHLQDWWYFQLQVWGQNPVKLRVVTKAPTIFISGSDDLGNLPGVLTYAFPNEWGTDTFTQFIEDPEDPDSYIPGDYWLGNSRGNWAEFGIAPANEDGINPIGQQSPYKAWIVWEGEDSSPDRLLTGQPGIRGIVNSGINLYTSHGLADFVAADLDDRLTARVISYGPLVIGGYKLAGTTVEVTQGATVDSMSQVEGETTWEATVTPTGGTITVSDGTSSAEAPLETTPPVTTAYPQPGTYSSAQSIVLTAYTDETETDIDTTATIYYTTDGTEPFSDWPGVMLGDGDDVLRGDDGSLLEGDGA